MVHITVVSAHVLGVCTSDLAQMCSPAQLRAQSEELYAAIDEVLESPVSFVSFMFSHSLTLSLLSCF